MNPEIEKVFTLLMTLLNEAQAGLEGDKQDAYKESENLVDQAFQIIQDSEEVQK